MEDFKTICKKIADHVIKFGEFGNFKMPSSIAEILIWLVRSNMYV